MAKPITAPDYPTEWQLLWTLGLAKPNKDGDKVRTKPERFSKIQAIAPVAYGNEGTQTFKGYHKKYMAQLLHRMRNVYFSSSTYFYNAHSLTDKSTWRELAGVHVEYALPKNRFEVEGAMRQTQQSIIDFFDIGNPGFPNAWSRDTPPDISVTLGGPDAGFALLTSALNYLKTHPSETVWVMNWDAPNYPSRDEQIN